MNQLVNDEGIYRTALATLGLLNTLHIRPNFQSFQSFHCPGVCWQYWSSGQLCLHLHPLDLTNEEHI